MGGGILHFELAGKPCLGFDTGLSDKAFAQAKMAQFLSRAGFIVYPPEVGAPARIEPWQASGVTELETTMVIWGPDVPGETLDKIIGAGPLGPDSAAGDASRDAALTALRYWIRARRLLAEEERCPPWPAGALVVGDSGTYPPGTVFFPPEQLVRRTIEAGGDTVWLEGAERWTHPDLTGSEADAFTAGALLYRIFGGAPPYPANDIDTVRQDIRDGVTVPLRLVTPELNEDLAILIACAIAPISYYTKQQKSRFPAKRPDLEALAQAAGETGNAPLSGTEALSGGAGGFFRTLTGAERAKIEQEREQFKKRTEVTVKTTRFVRRNNAIILGALAAAVIVGAIIFSTVRQRMAMFNTRGLTPVEVVETFYTSFNTLDHATMEACVVKKAGKEDINMVTNIFVFSRVRQAYQYDDITISPELWLEQGGQPTTQMVFGVSELDIAAVDTDDRDGEVSYRASYRLWGANTGDTGDDPRALEPGMELTPVLPQGMALTDEVRLVLSKGAWRIAEIRREVR
jgi:hypothetical protein